MVKALVLYHSQQYGNTEKMAEAVADGLQSEGCDVEVHNANNERFPIEEYPQYDCVALGTPNYFSYIAGTLKTFMDDWYINRNKEGYQDRAYAVFCSHGGGGKPREALRLFSRLGEKIGETVGSRGTPNEKVLEDCRNLGVKLADAGKN